MAIRLTTEEKAQRDMVKAFRKLEKANKLLKSVNLLTVNMRVIPIADYSELVAITNHIQQATSDLISANSRLAKKINERIDLWKARISGQD